MTQKDVDLENRDPNGLNAHIQVMFEDVLAEPEGVKSIDCVWSNAYGCFECGKHLCYKIFTLLCGICLGLCWGCTFAEVAFQHVWYFTPCLRMYSIQCGFCQKIYAMCLNCCCEPLFKLFGDCVGRIKSG
ncbi:caveolin-1-like [Mya arenaria]|nr:caveolin-1-like [Mya arenaria]